MNLDAYQWSPTMLSFNANPDDTAKSTSFHVYDASQTKHPLTKRHVLTDSFSFLTRTT
jgi:hypothetical protein